jgi:hypothetical protein
MSSLEYTAREGKRKGVYTVFVGKTTRKKPLKKTLVDGN